MFKKCPHCGFKNPPDIGDCLVCYKKLPTTIQEAKEVWEKLGKLSKGEVGGVVGGEVKDYVGGVASSVKYRFHPAWWLKVKIHRLKKTLINIFWIFAIIGGIVVFGLVYNFLRKIMGK